LTHYLEFEKPLAEIEGKAEELRSLVRANRETDVEAEAEALELMERARKVIAEAEETRRRRLIADEMFPLPQSPFGAPPQSGTIMAQIPPPITTAARTIRALRAVASSFDNPFDRLRPVNAASSAKAAAASTSTGL